jgi:hypothetical protein
VAAKYGYNHQELRAKVAPTHAAGLVACSRCGLPIEWGQSWDLDHRENGGNVLAIDTVKVDLTRVVCQGWRAEPA